MRVHEARRRLLADQLFGAMASVRRTARRRAERPAELSSLTGAQLELVRLVRHKAGVSVVEAASELSLAPNTVSTLVRQLRDLGFLSRSADPFDRRVARLDLRPDMRRKVDAWRDRRIEALSSAIGRLSAREERSLEETIAALQRLAGHLEAEEKVQPGREIPRATNGERATVRARTERRTGRDAGRPTRANR